MLASAGKDVPSGPQWVFEPKYDGIRIIALATTDAVALITRNGHDKCRQFPEITNRLRDLARSLKRDLVLDGEIVALDTRGEPARFQELQGRMHLADDDAVKQVSTTTPSAYIAFDILLDGKEALLDEPWDVRRSHLEKVLGAGRREAGGGSDVLRISGYVSGDAEEMLAEARRRGWEGIMAKRRDCQYEPGRRVRYWQKLKIENRQELVVGGWTEPRNSRKHFGALLLGYYAPDGGFVYAGHTGGGFSDRLLDDVFAKLRKLERRSSPFTIVPKTNERAHWAEPRVVVEVKFNEWTTSGVMRQPTFVGLRDDKNARDVVREPVSRQAQVIAASEEDALEETGDGRQATGKASAVRTTPIAAAKAKKTAKKIASVRSSPVARRRSPKAAVAAKPATTVVAQLRAEPTARHAALQVDGKTKLEVTNLGKIYFPVPKITKGQLMEFYADVSPYLLPALADRPLVLKRWPNGIKEGGEFYQQKAPDKVPDGVRVEEVADDGITTQRRLIGGNLATLLYIVQLGAISTDPWSSRVQSIADADYSIIDLDPMPKATFKRVINVARWVKEELDELGLHAVMKTSGASGMHIVLPLPRGASYDISKVLAELVARRVNEKHPKETTIMRAVKSRPQDAVYVDFLQNIRGKTVASVYSARAETYASVSTPLKWSELTDDLDPRDFTIQNVPARLKRVGDLWAAGMRRVNRLPGIIGDAAA
jgi:bifunctional non-homologous end joining protein LigD